jgi:hypothetical protein
MEHLSVYGSPVRGIWWGRSFTRDLNDLYRKTLETGIFLHTGPTGKPGKGLMHQGL